MTLTGSTLEKSAVSSGVSQLLVLLTHVKGSSVY